jgi:cellulose synthase/poly-beta-1,6-N-acetylglucosamine synthase-like glycosyltransferase
MSPVLARPARAVVVTIAFATMAPSVYLAILTAVGLPRPRPPRSDRTPSTRFVILVPAHDEAAGIAATLDSFRRLRYPSSLVSVHVVADNCTDDTATVVRHHGVDVHERDVPDAPGKGPALNWLFDRLVEADIAFDAVAIVDADTSLEPEFLVSMDRAISDGADVAQGYYSVRDPDASPSTSFRFAALACRHHLRALGRNRLGASCGLYGNGMAFRGELLARRRWSGHLVEDAELQNELLLDGHLVHYVPDAQLRAEMPSDQFGATSQNERWERGRIELARRFVPQLVRRALTTRRRRVAMVDAAVDHLVPPLSVLVMAQLAVGAVAALGSVTGSRSARRLLAGEVAALAIVAIHAVAGLISVGAPARHIRSLVAAPGIVLWKTRLWASVARGDAAVDWTRTRRNSERGAR